MIAALKRYYGYNEVKGGGKGSHRKLRSTLGYRQVQIDWKKALDPHVAKHVVHAINPKASLSDFPKVLDGSLKP